MPRRTKQSRKASERWKKALEKKRKKETAGECNSESSSQVRGLEEIGASFITTLSIRGLMRCVIDRDWEERNKSLAPELEKKTENIQEFWNYEGKSCGMEPASAVKI
ncbi:hypothetical protein Pmani_004046 [Petrolisthes manimaculis]|uniref:Uncharacterized protein n=1 Tax=Petrolisthes manimaculis TaxID=1843537 RepID=A0AAE1UIW1_9EUCA|nr:hypothetical protein Pmani_032089 [Petrolisthes manimaculis]KAK4325367.1 hypothetical protein Pmani_004046 [Petrolisthes manimaculis]